MYRCSECKSTFETPVVRGGRKLCVYCRCGAIEDISDELTTCRFCGERVLEVNNDGCCETCFAQLNELWDYVVMDAMLITHKDRETTDRLLKEYYSKKWRTDDDI